LARHHVEGSLYRDSGLFFSLIGTCLSGLDFAFELMNSDVPAANIIDLVSVTTVMTLSLHTVGLRLLAVSPHYKTFPKMARGTEFTVTLILLTIAELGLIWGRTPYLLGFMVAAWMSMGYSYFLARAMGIEWTNSMPWNLTATALEEDQARNHPVAVSLSMNETAPPEHNTVGTTTDTEEAPPTYSASIGTRNETVPPSAPAWNMPPAYRNG